MYILTHLMKQIAHQTGDFLWIPLRYMAVLVYLKVVLVQYVSIFDSSTLPYILT